LARTLPECYYRLRLPNNPSSPSRTATPITVHFATRRVKWVFSDDNTPPVLRCKEMSKTWVSIFILSAVVGLFVLGCASGLTNDEIQSIVKAEVASAVAELKEGPPGPRGETGPIGPAGGTTLSIRDQNRISHLERCISELENHTHSYTPPDHSHTHGVSSLFGSIFVEEWYGSFSFGRETDGASLRC